MSIETVRPGIHARLRSIPDTRNVIAGMPGAVHGTPAFITQFEGSARVGQTNVFHWRYMIHAIIAEQGIKIAEEEIDSVVVDVYRAFSPRLNDSGGRPRAKLGGAAETCWFEDVRSGDTDGYITIGEVQYRRIGFVLVVKTHEEF